MSYASFDELAIAEGLTTEERGCELCEMIHNMYKSIYGVRPRHMDLDSMTEEELLHEIDALSEAGRHMAEEESDEQYEARLFQESVQTMLICGAADLRTAERWARQVS